MYCLAHVGGVHVGGNGWQKWKGATGFEWEECFGNPSRKRWKHQSKVSKVSNRFFAFVTKYSDGLWLCEYQNFK